MPSVKLAAALVVAILVATGIAACSVSAKLKNNAKFEALSERPVIQEEKE